MHMKYILTPLLAVFFLSCHNGNGTQVQRAEADSLAQAVLDGRLDLKELANSNHFMYFDESYMHDGTDIKNLEGMEKVKAKVVAFRIYKHLTLENNRYVLKAKSPLDLHIPNVLFVNFERAFIASNNKAISSNDSIKLALPINFQDSVLTW